MDSQDTSSRVARLLRAIAIVEDGLLVGLLALMIVLAAAQIVLRNLLGSGLVFADPLLRLLVLWVGLLGAVAASRADKHITVDVVSRLLPARTRSGVRVVLDLFTAAVCMVVAYHAGRFVLSERAAGVTAFATLPTWLFELILPMAFTLIGLRYLLLATRHTRQVLRGDPAP